MASYEGFYQGGASAFDPEFGNLTGYNLSAATLGFPGSPQSANQVQDVVNAIKHGTKTFEVTMLQPDVGESIPKQHFNEMRALMKLTGVKPSVHAPLIDPAGFGEKGWSPNAREDNERRLWGAIEKAQKLDPSGDLPIVIHSANGAPGADWRPGDVKKGEDRFMMGGSAIVNKKTGQMQQVNREEKWRTDSFAVDKDGNKIDGYGKKRLFTAEKGVDSANLGEWENKLTEVSQMSKHAEELIGAAPLNLAEYQKAFVLDNGRKFVKINEDGSKQDLPPIVKDSPQYDSYEQMRKASLFLSNAELSFEGAFSHAYEYGTDKQKEELTKLAEDYSKDYHSISDKMVWSPHEKRKLLDSAILKIRDITKDRYVEEGEKVKKDPNWGAPKVWDLSENFAMEKASETFGNLAAKSYDTFEDGAPVLAIENLYQGMAFSRAEDMKKLVGKSRERFVDYLVKEKGFDEEKAKKLAEDKIGVTWDVGHLNMAKKAGFTDDDVIAETKTISEDPSMVKHLHLTDNFGYADTHLVPGMGNVPIKQHLEELEKTGRLGEMKKIVEAGGLIQHFKKLPHSMTLAAFGSGIYGMKAGPTWNQAVELQGNYFSGYGQLNPQTHHSYFGAGFTTMPVDLGGNMPGGASRFGGTPMA
jgi:sugar phosphate isomerase/epimerase